MPAADSSPAGKRVVRHAAVAAGAIVAAAGAFVLAGWIWDVQSFKTVYGPITMKANTAIGLLLCGTSLLLLHLSPSASTACAIAAGLIGAATLSEHIVGWDLGIDQLFFTEPPGAAATASPNRMGPNATVNFMMASVSLCLLRGGPRLAAAAQKLALAALVLAAAALGGYLYGAEQLYGLARYSGIALHTALAFAVLHLGILIARPDAGPVSVVLSDGPAGMVLRRLAVPVASLPLVVGLVEIYAVNAGIVDRGLGSALSTVALVVVSAVIVWHTAKVIDVTDRARRRAEHDRDTLIVSERIARAEAERASQLKDEFLATLSHELRTPLNVMLGWTHMLERGVSGADNVRIAGLVARNGQLLARLVEDLLDLSRVTIGQFEISKAPMNLNAIVENCVDAIAPIANAKEIVVGLELDADIAEIDADANRIQQIVWNLLSNAVKFSRTAGRVKVRTASSGGTATVTVSDDGVGFDAAFASEIFQPFRQADPSSRREHGGLGLGLSIARHLAELHGGSLTGSSPGIGQGATFTLTLPAAQRTGAHAGASAGRPTRPGESAAIAHGSPDRSHTR